MKETWAETKEVVEPMILPPDIIDDILGSVDNIVVFWMGRSLKMLLENI